LMTMQLCVRPCRGCATQRWTQLSDRFCNRLLIEGVRVRRDHAKGIVIHPLK
jgi:hypothetical protein